MTLLAIGSVAAAAAWVLLASLIPYLRQRHRFVAFWTMIVLGVPVLGWLTLYWGPLVGVGAFALGLWLLLRQPLRDCGTQGLPDARHGQPPAPPQP